MRKSFVTGLFVGVLMLLLVPSGAAAQSYPGTTTTPQPGATRSEQEGAALGRGGRSTIESCGFAPDTAATVTFNGAAAGEDRSEIDGCVRSTVEVLGTGACRVRINDGAALSAVNGRNTFEVNGTGANGAARTVTTSFDINCQAGSSLPRTGLDVSHAVGAGVALVVAGGLLVFFFSRSRRPLRS